MKSSVIENLVSRILADVVNVGIAARDVIAERLPRGPKSVALYDGFGTSGRALVVGRALRDEKIPAPSADDTRWQNLWAMLRRADADPLPRAVIHVTVGSTSKDITADDEGFFQEWTDAPDPRRIDDDWIEVQAELASMTVDDGVVRALGRILLPAVTPEFLVISDVDDTVLQSNVTSLVAAVRTVAFGNARTRLPFPGVAAFYQALRRGPTGTGRNPMFYVSSSPWNLYDVIRQFMEIHRIPTGPLLLRDVDVDLHIMGSRQHHEHKRDAIRQVLTTFADLPAILIGDSGQHDPEIYRDVVKEFPGRIRAIYIRNVSVTPERARAIGALADEVRAAGSSLLLADHTLAAARHAAELGLISSDALGSIES